MRVPIVLAMLITWIASPIAAAERLDVTVRGRAITLTVYVPRGAPRGTVFLGSGDVGWVGLAVSLADELTGQGYIVIGISARQYLAAFSSGRDSVNPKDVPADFAVFADRLKAQQRLVRPVIVAGVSEGAALAVLAAADITRRDWIDGVLTIGLPATAELAWHWSDWWASAMKKDADEPSFAIDQFLPKVAPLPLFMIQSRKDEYVTPADYAHFKAVARDPAQQVLIEASNHRFTDRRQDLGRAVAAGLQWIARSAQK